MFESFFHQLLDWFALPHNGLATVFFVALVSATLLPMGSEPAVFAYVSLRPDMLRLHRRPAVAGCATL